MCDCIKQVSAAALKQAESQLNNSIDEKLLPLKETWNHGMENVCFSMGKSEGTHHVSGLKLKTNLVFQTDFRKKDGSRSKPKNNNMSLIFTYCPFCGEEYDKNQGENQERSVATDGQSE